MVKFKKSKQRDTVLQLLSKKNYHPTVDDIYARVRLEFPKISLATVYRNVEHLCQMEKIWKIDMSGNPARYDGNMEKHFHVICERCSEVADVWPDKQLEQCINLESIAEDFTVTKYNIEFSGICDRCAGKLEN